jgi:uncharacterized protein YndB with AHSA1/START domain
MATQIEQCVLFLASPHALYEALMDSAQHTAFSGNAAEISREVGGSFMAYAGYISGENVELLPDQKIVQRWRAMDWPEDHFSLVTFVFTGQDFGTRLDFTHTDLPDGTEEEFRQGWIDNYWEPLKTFFEKKKSSPAISISLAQKLKLKPGSQAALLNAPEGYMVELAPERVDFDHVLAAQYDWIQVFVTSKAELDELYPQLLAALKSASLLWITFPKGKSKGKSDLTRDQGWEVVQDLKWIKLVAINHTWSAFSLRPYKPGEAHKSFR